MTIYKYPIGMVPGRYSINAPIVKILGVFLDLHDKPCLYIIVDPNLLAVKENFATVHVFWTGMDLPDEIKIWTYLTSLIVGGHLMCHYFLEESKKNEDMIMDSFGNQFKAYGNILNALKDSIKEEVPNV